MPHRSSKPGSRILGGTHVRSRLLGIPPNIEPTWKHVVARVYSFPTMFRSSFIPLTYAFDRFATRVS